MSNAGFVQEPPLRTDTGPVRAVERAAAYAGPLMVGLGLIMWLAANWDGFGRYGRFAIVAGALAVSVAGALAVRKARPGFLLLGFLAAGGLFALIGQTYQTGADPWSLFAIWALLTLPFALAARSDAVWCGWIVVALAGVTLWAHNTGGGLFDERSRNSTVLVAWAVALTTSASLSPWSPLKRSTGNAAWAWRLGLWLTSTQIGLLASAAILFRTDTAVYFGGLALLGAIAILILRQKPFDILAGAIVGLAIDIVLIVGATRMLFGFRNAEVTSVLVIGLLSAGIVAATATILLKRMRASAEESGAPSPRPGETPWPVAVMTGFGALIASIPLIGFYVLFVSLLSGEALLRRGPLIYVLGALTLGIAVMALRKPNLGRFAEIFALIFAVVGMLQIGFGAFRDLPIGIAAALNAVACAALALALPQRWIATILGAAGSVLAGLALIFLIVGLSSRSLLGWLGGTPHTSASWHFSALQFAELALVVAVTTLFVFRGDLNERLKSFLTGWIAATLINQALKSGQTFLVGAFTGLPNQEVTLVGGIPFQFRIVPFLLAAAGVAWLLHRKPGFRTPLVLGWAGVALTMTAIQPLFGPVAFIGAMMLTADKRRLALLSGLAALWILGAWYYAVTMPLTQKGIILMGLGAAIGGLALLTRKGDPATAPNARSGSDARLALAPALITFGGLAIAGLAGWSIWDKERILREGRMVMLRIVPVDPRSLLQGDYMTLAFELPQRRAPASARQPGGPQPVAIGTIGPDQVVKVTEIVLKRPALAPDQIAIALSVKNSLYVVGSDAWFFKEGDAGRFAGARYGIFRVTTDGTALLAGLADEAKQPIR